jgi:UDP-N-acetylmuramoyl-tripeptide--D-alanyl-D-alanine ligase
MTLLFALAFSLAVLFASWRIWRRLRYCLHVFQLEGYKVSEFAAWVARRPRNLVLRNSHLVGIAILALSFPGYAFLDPTLTGLLVSLAWSVAFASSKRYRSERQKKPLVYTYRLRRLLAIALFFVIVPVAIAGWSSFGRQDWPAFMFGGLLAADLLAPLFVMIAGVIARPVEVAIQHRFKRRAKRRLARRPDLRIVAVTGSYGKTSVKFAIAEILRQRLNVLATPGSYNTPMGLCKVINEQLRPAHQVLILEMGARKPGDIAELCQLATPDIGVVTNVGIAHLETMGSVEGIEREKGALPACVPRDGAVILNADDPRVRGMTARTKADAVFVSAQGYGDASVSVSDVSVGSNGTSFRVTDSSGSDCLFETALLGDHNVMNIALGVAVGQTFGLTMRQMAHAVRRLRPVPHRLELKREGETMIIDDSFNSNPVGARSAVEVLGRFRGGRRIVVTPGMIELGERQWQENFALGRCIADNVDVAILVGKKQTEPIRAGLEDAGFASERVVTVGSLFEARDHLSATLRPGDTVLFENDLPDQYDEAT